MPATSSPTIPALPAGADHPVHRFAFDYWLSKAPPGKLPGRQHIDPVELKPVLPNVLLIDVERQAGAPRFRMRLIGTAMSDAIGYDMTGRYFDLNSRLADVISRLTQLLKTRTPYYAVEHVTDPHRRHVVLRRLLMPLAADGETVDMVFGVCVVQPYEEQAT